MTTSNRNEHRLNEIRSGNWVSKLNDDFVCWFEFDDEDSSFRDAYLLLEKSIEPPGFAEFLLGIISDRKHREAVVGCAFEKYRARCADPNCGPRRAKRMYWQELFWSAGPLIWRWVKRSGLWGAIGAGVSRLFS